ncbi:MAG: exopolysaccharide biosynthesis protein [Rhodospirillales bacterium]|nr:exopolysaccharide biosynthesis protein [Rhodospirillales bacterium]
MTSSSPPDAAVPYDGRRSIREMLAELLARHREDDIVLGDILAFLGERAFGALLLILALPMATPLSAIPGVSSVFGLPMVIICAQLMLGYARPLLPDALARRTVRREALVRALERADPWLIRIERAVHPRMPSLTGPRAERAIGAAATFMATLLALPIPGANQPPALAVSLFAVALIERDGVFAILGWIAVFAAIAIFVAIYGVLFAAGMFMFGKVAG